MNAHDHYLDEFGRVRTLLPGRGASWVTDLRGDALAWFAAHGLPTSRDEDWKYTSTTLLERERWPISSRDSAGQAIDRVPALDWPIAAHRLVFLDGHFCAAQSSLLALPPGATLASLRSTLERDPAVLEAHLGRIARFDADGFAALNAALFADGAYLSLPPGVELEAPVILVFASTGGSASFARNLLVLGEGARATVIEHHLGVDAGYLNDTVTEIVQAPAARLDHIKLQQEGASAFHVGAIHALQEADSRLLSQSLALGARWSRTDIHARLDAEGCECVLDGLYVGRDRQHVDHHTRIDHARPRGRSREYYKGILDGAARGVFSGRIVVHEDAQQTDAQQSNRNLLLSEDAEVDTKPQLEIYADDVKCSHGATVGQLEPEQLFYLQSRGLDLDAARGLLTYAFAREVIDRVRLDSLRSVFDALLLDRLPAGLRVRELT